MESARLMTEMESGISRHGNMNYETAATWRRDPNFNLQQTNSPGWMLNATAIGNLINVQTVGSGNTVVVNAMQINRGMQQAVITMSSDRIAGPTSSASATSTAEETVSFQASAKAVAASSQPGQSPSGTSKR